MNNCMVLIAHIASADSSIRYLLLDQLKYLRDRGHEVHAIASPGPHSAAVERAGIRFHPVDLSRRITPLRDAAAFVALSRTLARIKPDLVHTHTPKASLLGQYAALAMRVPHRVHTIHGLYLPPSATGVKRQAFLELERVTMWPAHAVLSQSNEDVTTCQRERICSPERISFLGNGIDIDRFSPPTPAERLAARAAFGVPADHRVVGFVGRLVREKGVLELMQAARAVLAAQPATTFLFVGPSDVAKKDAVTDAELSAIAKDDRIRFLGHRDDLPVLYRALDLLVHPSHREGFPRVPMEASATGVPVVATDIRGCREAVESGVNGLLTPVSDVSALTESIQGLLADDARRESLKQGARAIAERRFDQRLVFERVLETYGKLLRDHATASASA
jgi:glycosyltransferase involved in cell wall biosynthesis